MYITQILKFVLYRKNIILGREGNPMFGDGRDRIYEPNGMHLPKPITRIYIFLLYTFLAFEVNFGYQLFITGQRISFSVKDTAPLILVTIMLLVGYTRWVCGVRDRFFTEEAPPQAPKPKQVQLVRYVLVASLPVISVHALFLQIPLAIAGEYNVYQSRYWACDFVFFAVPLFLYIVLIYYAPAYKLFRFNENRVAKPDNFQMWLYGRDPRFLRRHLRQVYGKNPVVENNAVQWVYIVFIQYVEGSYVAHLVNGEKLVINFKPSAFHTYTVRPWFIKLSARITVNMLYVHYPVKQIKKLRLEKGTAAVFEKNRDAETLENFLNVTRRMEIHVKKFVENREDLQTGDWNERIALR